MPLMHAEDRELQALGVAKFTGLADSARGLIRFAEMHREIVEQFGRFPHRNVDLGRELTANERAYVARHGNPFS